MRVLSSRCLLFVLANHPEQRAKKLIELAHSNFKEALLMQAKEMSLIM